MTPYHSQYWANLLTLKGASGTIESLSRSISNSRVDLNPHQVDAALFALRSPLSRGTILADEVYGELGFEGPVPPFGTLDPAAPIISLSSLSKAYLAPGWRAGWLVVSPTRRLDDALAAMRKLADGRLCSPGPMQYAIAAALTGDRSHQPAFRQALAERGRLTTDMLNAIPGVSCVAPRAAFYVLPSVALPPGKTDEDYVLALLRDTGILQRR